MVQLQQRFVSFTMTLKFSFSKMPKTTKSSCIEQLQQQLSKKLMIEASFGLSVHQQQEDFVEEPEKGPKKWGSHGSLLVWNSILQHYFLTAMDWKKLFPTFWWFAAQKKTRNCNERPSDESLKSMWFQLWCDLIESCWWNCNNFCFSCFLQSFLQFWTLGTAAKQIKLTNKEGQREVMNYFSTPSQCDFPIVISWNIKWFPS